MTLTLHGYHYSVYTRIVRMVLAEKRVSYDYVEVDPFADDVPSSYLQLHPFGRVPALIHDGFALYETAAITRYLDEAFAKLMLQPMDARKRARMNQIIAVVDSYGYWPMVRQVFAHRVFRTAAGEAPDEAVVASGLAASEKVIAALEALAERPFLNGEQVTLADMHLAPMVAYFTAAPEGAELLRRYPGLDGWWQDFRHRDSLQATDPGLPGSRRGR
ncbi:glutathione S-transferase family protein [Nitratireductor mangrovi]|uniref:glutathione transferase n=1 Tax=Nitratireductor mangrovi TaxID=2599600 RepID=A0A5B8L4G6_9HYPH|nr:glutathione S-transferase family protein [Nitratireductor mangrovi]QDZ02835.1 glutathione S-transferase family protein [Nitratireductor mangrovi]